MKLRQLMFLFMLPFAVSSYADGVDVYQLKMSVKVPRVYDNM